MRRTKALVVVFLTACNAVAGKPVASQEAPPATILPVVFFLLVQMLGCGGPMEPSRPVVSEFFLGIAFGPGFGYGVTFQTGGNATDVRSVELRNDVECSGRVSREVYDGAAKLFEAEGFFPLDSQYGFNPGYPGPVVTSAVRDGIRKVVRNYRGAAPPPLMRIQQTVRVLREGITWVAKSGQPLDQQLCSFPFFFGEPE